jgi:hypothetical protein
VASTCSCGRPFGSADRNASQRPSGENTGAKSRWPEVSGTAREDPSVGTVQSWLRYSSASRSSRDTATTAVAPSGDTVGTPGVRSRERSVGRMDRTLVQRIGVQMMSTANG